MIYVHIPFCVRKCKYCAFNSIVGSDLMIDDYVNALSREIKQKSISDEIETIYIGGGTPTLLKVEQLNHIINVIAANYNLTNNIEFTIEANPGTINKNYLGALKNLGVNRVSVGVQSFNDKLLRVIGRIHNSDEAIAAIKDSVKVFDNVSLDLMYGLPNQTVDDVRRSIKIADSLGVNHISIYGLEIEEGTEFCKLNGQGQLNLPSDIDVEAMYDFITSELPKLGYIRYEISNFAKPGFESRHNLGYWNDAKYFGFGAGAHSYDRRERRANLNNVTEYISKINAGQDVSTLEEIVTQQAAMEEFCFLGLRTADGISINKFRDKFNDDIKNIFGNAINKLCSQQLLEIAGDKIRLTKRGMKFGNVVFSEFLL